MAKKVAAKSSVTADVSPRQTSPDKSAVLSQTQPRPSALVDTRVVYCGDNLEQLAKLPDGPCRTGQCWGSPREITPRATTSHRLHRISRGETKEKRAFEDRHENTKAYPATAGRPRCVQLARVLKMTGSFYYHCDWHASHYVKVMLDQIFGENNFFTALNPSALLILH
jgi:hypothetical protein